MLVELFVCVPPAPPDPPPVVAPEPWPLEPYGFDEPPELERP